MSTAELPIASTDATDEVATPQSHAVVDGASDPNVLKWLTAGVAAWMVGSGLLLYFHFSHTLAKPHYQYVLLIPPVVAYLLWNRHSSGKLKIGSPSIVWAVLWLLPLGLMGAASWLFSPWIGMLALVVLGPATCLALGGWRLLQSTWGIWLLVGFLLPLPLQADERLIVKLRDVATRVTSGVLDHFGILHMLSGNVIELPEKKLFVADACSGIHSLFVLLAAAAIVAVWNYRGPIATAVLLVGTFGLVMVENIVRLLSVSLSIRWGYDLSEGTGHQVLGFVLFGFSLLLILSLDQWIAFFTIKRSKKKTRRAFVSVPLQANKLKCFAGFGCAAVLLLPLQWTRMPSEIPSLGAGFTADITLPELGESFLPANTLGFERVNYEIVERVMDDPFGHHSQIWRYQRGQTEISVSLNYVYREIHDACVCYRNIGWEVTGERVLGFEDTGEVGIIAPTGTRLPETPCLLANMSNPLEGNALLMYAMLSESGKIGVGIYSRSESVTNRSVGDRFAERVANNPEQWVQLQMTVLRVEPFSDSDIAEIEQFFREMQGSLFTRVMEEISK